MTLLRRVCPFLATFFLAHPSFAHAQQFGKLSAKFALGGQTELFAPARLVGPELRTPRKGAPFLYAAWRQEIGTQGSPGFNVTIAMINVYQDDPKRFGLGLVFDRDGQTLHYASPCSPNAAPKCDPNTRGLSHDVAGKKIKLTNAVFVRVSLKDIDPRDTITVNGELSYAQ